MSWVRGCGRLADNSGPTANSANPTWLKGAQYSTFNPKLVSEHGEAALGRLARGLVLNHIPMLHENPIFHSNYIRRNPVHRQADTRKAPVQDDKVPFGHNRSCFISKRRRNALDETEQAIATRRDMSAVLDITWRPKLLSRGVVTLVEKRVEGFEDKRFFFDSIV